MALVPILLIIAILVALAIIGSGIFAKVVAHRNKTPLVTFTQPRYFIVLGNTEHEISAADVKSMKRQGYTVIQK